MKKDWFDISHASQYLSGSVILYQGEPVYIHSVDYTGDRSRDRDRWSITYSLLHQTSNSQPVYKEANVFADEWDLSTIPLGLCNHNGWAYNVMRTPRRMWKVGLTSRSLVMETLVKGQPEINKNKCLFSRSFSNMAKRRYPSYDRVFSDPKDFYTVAFSPEFAITTLRFNGEDRLLLHRYDKIVGEAKKDGPVLSPEYKYLQESLSNDLNIFG